MAKKSLHLVGIFTAFFALTLFFQNCQPALKFASLDSLTAKNSGGGNGDGYGGKPGGFYRFTPEYSCEGKEAPVASLSEVATGFTYTENKKLQCGITSNLSSDLIDKSIYQDDIVGYLEGIYQGEKLAPTAIPSNLVEVWCRDSVDRSGIETITHYDRSTQLAVTRIHSAGTGSSVLTVPDFNVSRILSPMLVTVTDGKDFSLKVYRDRPAAQLGLFQGSLEAMVNGQKVKRDTSCRLGGSLDVKVWPSRQIVDMNILTLKVSPDLQSVGFTSKMSATVTDLFAGSVLGTSQAKMNWPIGAGGVSNFEFSPDSNYLVYWSNQRLLNTYELFRVTRDGTRTKQLEISSSANFNNGGNSKIQFSPDGSQVVYMDNPLTAAGANNETLNSVSLNGSSPIVLNPPMPNASLFHYFDVSKSLNKAAFFFGAPKADLYISNLDGTGLFRAASAYSVDGWEVAADFLDHPIQWSGTSQFVFVRSLRPNPGYNSDFMYSAIAADGSGIVSLPVNWDRVSSNAVGNIVLLSNNRPPASAYKLMNLNTGNMFDLPGIEPQSFSKDGASLIGTETDSAGQSHGVLVDVADGKKAAVCPQVSLKTPVFKELENERWLMAGWDDQRGVFSVYVHASGQCVLKNSLPLSKPAVQDVHLAPDFQSAVFLFQNQLYFVPLNGKPPLRIDSPIFNSSAIMSVQVLPDSKSVVYSGQQLKAGEHNAFLWKAP